MTMRRYVIFRDNERTRTKAQLRRAKIQKERKALAGLIALIGVMLLGALAVALRVITTGKP